MALSCQPENFGLVAIAVSGGNHGESINAQRGSVLVVSEDKPKRDLLDRRGDYAEAHVPEYFFFAIGHSSKASTQTDSDKE
jgi:hypothetical protein